MSFIINNVDIAKYDYTVIHSHTCSKCKVILPKFDKYCTQNNKSQVKFYAEDLSDEILDELAKFSHSMPMIFKSKDIELFSIIQLFNLDELKGIK